jgi:hypothetical protein
VSHFWSVKTLDPKKKLIFFFYFKMINYFKDFNSKTILMVSGSISIAFDTYYLVKYRNNLKQLVSFNQNFLNSDQEDRIIKKILHLSEEQNLLYSKLIKDLKNFHLEQNLNNILTHHMNETNIDTTNQYPVMYTELGSSLYGTVTPIIQSSIRIILAMFILTSINIMNAFEFRKRYSHRIQSQVPHAIESK